MVVFSSPWVSTKEMIRGLVTFAVIASSLLLGGTHARAQDSLDFSPGMSYAEVKSLVTANFNLVYQAFDPTNITISTSSRRYIPGLTAQIVFCPGSTYDGRAITVVTTERFTSKEASAMIQRFHDLFQRMSGDQVGDIISTRTESDEGRKLGSIGVSIKQRLKNGEIWDLGMFNRKEEDEHFIQLVRTVSPDVACKR